MRSLVISIFLYTCESWTFTAVPQRIIRAMEVRCYREILRISYKDHVTNKEIKVNGQKLDTVTSFRYLGSLVSDEGSRPEILTRIAQTTAALTRLKPILNDRSIFLSSKIRLMRSLVISIFLYSCES